MASAYMAGCESSQGPSGPITAVIRAPQRCKLPAIPGAWNSAVSDAVNKPADVLVIDDDAVMRELVADWLEGAGYCVRKAADCHWGLAPARRGRPARVATS